MLSLESLFSTFFTSLLSQCSVGPNKSWRHVKLHNLQLSLPLPGPTCLFVYLRNSKEYHEAFVLKPSRSDIVVVELRLTII